MAQPESQTRFYLIGRNEFFNELTGIEMGKPNLDVFIFTHGTRNVDDNVVGSAVIVLDEVDPYFIRPEPNANDLTEFMITIEIDLF